MHSQSFCWRSILRNQRGTTFFELIVVLGIVGVASAAAIPQLANAVTRNRVFTGSELVAAQIRQARLAAITRNTNYRVRFACPEAGAVRVLIVTGDTSIDNASDRCSQNIANDSPAVYLPSGVTLGSVPTLEVNGRGVITPASGSLPVNISVSHGAFSRTLSVTASGRVSTPTS